MRRIPTRRTVALTAVAAAAALGAAGVASGESRWGWWPGGGAPSPRPPVELGATPASVALVPLPCFGANVTLAMRNPGTEDVYAAASVIAQPPVQADRGAFSSWLPAGWTARAPVALSAPRDAAPGDYELRVRSGAAEASVAVRVSPAPPKGPGDNLAYGEQATASSTHGNFDVCGAVDGNADSEQWDTLTGWNDGTRAVFPDTYGVTLGAPATVDRVKLQTLDSRRYPAARNGLRDWDVRVRVGGEWQTVAEVRGNTAGVVESRFDPVTADAVEVVARASNDGLYSRIVELEVRGGGG
jgi:hypothetical protein